MAQAVRIDCAKRSSLVVYSGVRAAPNMNVPMTEVFETLGFEKFDPLLSSMPGYRMQFGPHEIEAVVQVNQRVSEVFVLSGIIHTGRTLGSIEAQLPLIVQSHAEGLALLSFFLNRQIPERHKPPWLRIGERMKSELPWYRSA